MILYNIFLGSIGILCVLIGGLLCYSKNDMGYYFLLAAFIAGSNLRYDVNKETEEGKEE